MSEPAPAIERTRIRYRLPLGERFTIEATTRERVSVDGGLLLELHASFALACEVVDARGDVVEILGHLERPRIGGRAPGGLLPDIRGLEGGTVRVVKGLDGRVHEALDAGGVEAIFGGLTAANALRWFSAAFPSEAVAPGEEWVSRDRWVLRTDRTPLRISLPLHPVVDVTYRYRLLRAREPTEIGVAIGFSGGGHSDALGVEVGVTGEGTGRVVVDGTSGKLTVSERRAAFTLQPRATRPGALALPPLHVERHSEAGYRAG